MDSLFPSTTRRLGVATLMFLCACANAQIEFPDYREREYRIDEELLEKPIWEIPEDFLRPPPSAAWERECSGLADTHYGSLKIADTSQIDPTRCIRFVFGNGEDDKSTGDLTFDGSEDNDFHQLGRPYLETVSGSLAITGGESFDELYFPRLRGIGGALTIDYNAALEYVDMPRMSRLNAATIYFRGNNVDMNGMNPISRIGQLTLENTPNDPGVTAPIVAGLNGVTQLDSLTVTSEAIQLPANGVPDVLTALQRVTGNVRVYAEGLNRLFGLDSLQTVDGNIELTGDGLQSLAGMGSLQTLAGTLKLTNMPQLRSLDGLNGPLLNRVIITDLPDLNNINALLNASFTQNAHVRFEQVPDLNCTAISSLASVHPQITVDQTNSNCR